jgi:hypothetical protein
MAFERIPTRQERFWARRFVLIAVVLAVIAVVVCRHAAGIGGFGLSCRAAPWPA